MSLKNNIFITGGNGFVGQNIILKLRDSFSFSFYVKDTIPEINSEVVIHLAGKAHDTKKVVNENEYYQINTELTKTIFDAFRESTAEVFIFLSSVKAAADFTNIELVEKHTPSPQTHYGKSKLLAEQYINTQKLQLTNKRIYILRPCMIHGPGNKGNLNFLYKFVSKGYPWPLAGFDNSRSFCSIENLIFVIKELIQRNDITSGTYQIADDTPLSTNKIIDLIKQSTGSKTLLIKIPRMIILALAKIGDYFNLPFNSDRFIKLTENYIVSNKKLKLALGKSLPVESSVGMLETLNSFNKNVV